MIITVQSSIITINEYHLNILLILIYKDLLQLNNTAVRTLLNIKNNGCMVVQQIIKRKKYKEVNAIAAQDVLNNLWNLAYICTKYIILIPGVLIM